MHSFRLLVNPFWFFGVFRNLDQIPQKADLKVLWFHLLVEEVAKLGNRTFLGLLFFVFHMTNLK